MDLKYIMNKWTDTQHFESGEAFIFLRAIF